jgi:hypothetical protein
MHGVESVLFSYRKHVRSNDDGFGLLPRPYVASLGEASTSIM